MLALLVLALLAAVGVLLAYRFSPAAKLKARLRKALSPFEDLDFGVDPSAETTE